MVEKLVLQEEEEIIAYDFLTIKPLAKSSQGSLI